MSALFTFVVADFELEAVGAASIGSSSSSEANALGCLRDGASPCVAFGLLSEKETFMTVTEEVCV